MSSSSQPNRSQASGSQNTRATNAGDEQGATSQRKSGQESQQGSSETQEKLQRVAKNVAGASQQAASHFVGEPAQDLMSLAKQYVKDKPDIAAMWCFGFGIIVGWKLRG